MNTIKFIRHLFVQAGGTFLSRVSGMVRDIVIAKYLGVGIMSDIFFIAFRIPNSFRKLFGEGALSVTFIPIFVEELKKSPQAARHFAAKIIVMLALTLCSIILMMEIFVPQIILILAPGLSVLDNPITFDLAVYLTRLLLPFMLFICLTAVMGGILNSVNHFGHFAVTPIILNLGSIGFLLLTKGIFSQLTVSLAFGVLISGILQLIFLIIVCYFYNILPLVRFDSGEKLFSPNVKKFFRNLFPTIFGQGVFQINVLVDIFFASFHTGNVSYMYYTDRMGQFATSIIGHTIGIVSLSVLTQGLQKNGVEEGQRIQKMSTQSVLAWSLPATFSLAILTPSIIKILFQRGGFTATDTQFVAGMTQIFCLAIPFICLTKVYQACFYAMQDVKTPVRIGMIAVASNFILNAALIKLLPYYSVILATSCSAIIECLALAYYLKKYYNFLSLDRTTFIFMCKIVIASILVAVSSSLLHTWMLNYINEYISLVVVVGYGLTSYIATLIAAQVITLATLKDLRIRSHV